MKQPALGQKIQEWRKAKGLTQEELVERCNINVRTIQRIEAGEVTPRSYTIRAIMEVLDIKPEDLPEITDTMETKEVAALTKWLRFSFVAGIIYLVFAIIESIFDASLFIGEDDFSVAEGYFYNFVKMGALVLFMMFMMSFYKLGQLYDNLLMKVSTVFLIILTVLFITEDVVVYWMQVDLYSGLLMRSLIVGLLYVLFASAFLHLSRGKGNLYLVTGVIGLLTGVCFMTYVLAVPGLILLTAFELLLIVLLHKEYQARSGEQSFPAVEMTA